MTVKYVVLADEIEDEIKKLKEVEKKIYKYSSELSNSEKHDVYLDSVALNLHAFYTGIENIFKAIASKVDGDVPKGESWHSELLSQMTTSLNEVRPKVISKKILPALRDLLAFRHRIRNIYSFQIDEQKVVEICDSLDAFGKELFTELKEFVVFLKKTGENS